MIWGPGVFGHHLHEATFSRRNSCQPTAVWLAGIWCSNLTMFYLLDTLVHRQILEIIITPYWIVYTWCSNTNTDVMDARMTLGLGDIDFSKIEINRPKRVA